ncbi:electron transport complex, RnfABCDGE type, E subunit [Beggiatoa alba B18LD]|uniref:Ion-translocating oxidoreductase complex subunit E n=1 Tax=Beggiatoa alba B18LD TaxID=395493 RepID=I3CCA9_9GAMM|nr:electron transport complex subunit E [Beggiatoa alba]EIJ41252.1 electron transport complex, RnfABCDGE type, E subunit [Beggiatoa alba B18LD]
MATNYGKIMRDGLWDNNPVLAQQLALCPALAVTTTATNGLGMGLSTLLVLVLTNLVIALVRDIVTPEVRIPVFIVLIAAVVTIIDMCINAFLHDLYKVLGLFIPLIVTNCVILGRAESFASRNSIPASIVDGFAMGLGFTIMLTIMGGIREIIGSGTLFAQASSLLGQSFHFLEMTIIPDYKGYLLMILPPGAFIVMGFLIAAKRVWESRRKTVSAPALDSVETPAT